MIKNKDRWSQLSMQQRADLIKLYVDNGVTSLNDIKKGYNSFGDGGDTESPVDGGEIEASIITPRQSRINKRRMRKELFTKIKSTLESNDDIIQLYNSLPEDQRKRALESIMKFSPAADPKIVKDWFIEEAKKHPLKAVKALDYVITGNGQPVLFEPSRKYAYNGLFGGDYYFDKQTPIDNGIIDAMLYNREINSDIGVQSNKQDYGPEINYINRVYPDKNIQYIETRPEIDLNQEGIQPTIYYGAQGSFKTSLPKRVINNQGIIIQEGVRNDSTFVRGLDVYDFKPDDYVSKWVDDSSMISVIKQIDEDTNPVAIKTPWVYKDDINDIISSRTGLNDFEFNTIDSNKSVYKTQKAFGGKLNKFKTGGPTREMTPSEAAAINKTLDNEGGWSASSRARRERRYDRYDPTGNYILQPLYMLMGGNQAAGEENEYWKAYLGLKNAVPKMNPNAKTSWDDAIEAEKVANGELLSDFYGTTPRMDLNIQAIADTLNTGKILRNYDKYKEGKYYFPNKRTIEEIYKTGKKVLDNPNTWQQVEGDVVAFKNEHDDYANESNPLGMLADFGMMWDPKTKSIYVHDTYDFGPISQIFAGKRPKEMKIRSKISFDPAKGSKLLRNDLENYYDYPKALTTHAYGGRILSGEEN